MGGQRDAHVKSQKNLTHPGSTVALTVLVILWPWAHCVTSLFIPFGKQECNPGLI